VHLDDGFDFLGFNVRRYRGKLLIKPSKSAVLRLRKRIAAEMLTLRGSNARAVIARLNPIIRGWSAYYRSVVSQRVVFQAGCVLVDAHSQVGQVQPLEQIEALGHQPVLRLVQ
jgi:hypothetical protein